MTHLLTIKFVNKRTHKYRGLFETNDSMIKYVDEFMICIIFVLLSHLCLIESRLPRFSVINGPGLMQGQNVLFLYKT